MKHVGTAVALLTSGALLVAPATVGAASKVSVKASEFKFSLAKKSVGKGKVKFTIKNAGHVAHNFKINGKKSKTLAAGKSTTLSVTFKKAGKYKYLCTVDGHASLGMKGTLTVK
jgi:uncharacterized cupredoxin-like copper-binding protein